MKATSAVSLLDPDLIRHRRMKLGLTAAHLGSLCGVSSGVIRRIESGAPQDDLTARFISSLADQLGASVSQLLTPTGGDTEPTSEEPDAEPDDARELGALLFSSSEQLPTDAICDVLDWDLDRLELAREALNEHLEPAGGVVVDDGWALFLTDDLSAVGRTTIDAAAKAALAQRRPHLNELRVVHETIHGEVTRHEDLDTAGGMVFSRLRTAGVLTSSKPDGVKPDPPKLSDDVVYSLLLEDQAETVN